MAYHRIEKLLGLCPVESRWNDNRACEKYIVMFSWPNNYIFKNYQTYLEVPCSLLVTFIKRTHTYIHNFGGPMTQIQRINLESTVKRCSQYRNQESCQMSEEGDWGQCYWDTPKQGPLQLLPLNTDGQPRCHRKRQWLGPHGEPCLKTFC